MHYPEPRINAVPPFVGSLRFNIDIEVHVAMRLGELIKASNTEDKQLMALGHRLSFAMNNLVDQLDNKQFDNLAQYIEEQVQEDSYKPSDSNAYVAKARKSFPNPATYNKSF
jgi:hypothetical protein